jgi:hypothetical protein
MLPTNHRQDVHTPSLIANYGVYMSSFITCTQHVTLHRPRLKVFSRDCMRRPIEMSFSIARKKKKRAAMELSIRNANDIHIYSALILEK